MGGGAILPPFTNTVGGGHSNNSFTTPPTSTPGGSNFHSTPSLSSICNTPFGESWTKCRCIDYGSRSKTLDIEQSFDEIGSKGSTYDSVFGSAPSCMEVEKAMSDLQSFMRGYYAPKEEMNWHHTILNPHQSTLLQSPGHARLCDAFDMLQNEPSVQRLVLSIASDEAIWVAMMNNKAVQDLQGSLICAAKEEESQNSTGESGTPSLIVKLITDITRFAELIQSFVSLLSEIFREIPEPAKKEKPTSELSDLLEEKIRSSFLLSVVLLLIVVMTRNEGV